MQRPRPAAFGLLILAALALVGLAAQPLRAATEADRLRQESREALADAAKKRALAKTYRMQAESLRSRAAEAKTNAADARKRGKSDLADTYEQHARQDESEALRRLDTAADFDRQAETLEKTARDKAEAADRVGQDDPNADSPTATYQRARATLQKASDRLADLRLRGATQWVGKEYDTNVAAYTTLTQEKLTELFAEPIQEVEKQRAELDAALAKYKAKQMGPDDLASQAYRSVYYGVPYAFGMELRSGVMEIQILLAQHERAEERLNQTYAGSKKAIQSAYAAGSLTSVARDARVAALDEKMSMDMHALFDRTAGPYGLLLHSLARARLAWADEVKSWHDWAAKHSKAAGDAHASWAADFDKSTFSLFSKEAGPALRMNVVDFAFVPGSPDRLNTHCSSYKWCKAGLYPEIQDPEDPCMFRMHHIVDVKLKDSVLQGTADGAAGNEPL